jgi:hypothetical protein
MNSVIISISRNSAFPIPGTPAGSMNGPLCFIIMPGTRPRSACFGYPSQVDAGESTGRARIAAANPTAPFPADFALPELESAGKILWAPRIARSPRPGGFAFWVVLRMFGGKASADSSDLASEGSLGP